MDNATETIKECEMFYATAQLYAFKTGGENGREACLQKLFQTINLSLKQNLSAEEKNLYAKTVDAIWDCYDSNLSTQADPKRLLYNKYKKIELFTGLKVAYLMHAPGPVSQPAIEAKIYKRVSDSKPDLAILTTDAKVKQSMRTLDLAVLLQGNKFKLLVFPLLLSQMLNL